MKRKLALAAVLCIALVAVMAVSAAPGWAITQGELDGQGHPNVGVIVAEYKGELEGIGSGTLIAPRIVLTAAHVAAYIQSFADDTYVSFAPVFDPTAGKAALVHGTIHTNPDFSQRQDDPGDVAVIVLDTPQTMAPAALPPADILDSMAARNGLKGAAFTCVGYGTLPPTTGGGAPVFGGFGTRRVSVSSFMALTAARLFMSQNAATGDGGTGYGDSGGPIFMGQTGTLAALTMTGDIMLRATNVAYRLDTATARAFLAQFSGYGVTLP